MGKENKLNEKDEKVKMRRILIINNKVRKDDKEEGYINKIEDMNKRIK